MFSNMADYILVLVLNFLMVYNKQLISLFYVYMEPVVDCLTKINSWTCPIFNLKLSQNISRIKICIYLAMYIPQC